MDIAIGVARRTKDENGERITDFIPIQCWDSTARFVGTYLKKGDKISVTGELRQHKYTDQTGQKRNILEVVASSLDSVNGRKVNTEDKKAAPAGGGFTEIDDDDLPF